MLRNTKFSDAEKYDGAAPIDPIEAQNQVSILKLLAIAALSFVVLFAAMHRDFDILDEGIILTDALRVLHSEIIHRDFYSNYGPAQYYLVASMFRIFDDEFLVARVYDLAVRSAIITMLLFMIRRQCAMPIALIFTAAGGMWMLGTGYFLYPIFPCILLSLIGSYLVARTLQGASMVPMAFGAGACTGLTALFRYDTGFSLLAAHLFSIAVMFALSQTVGKTRRALLAFVAYGSGAAVVFLPAAIAFLVVSPIGPFVADIIDYPTKYYVVMRRLPFPGLASIRADPVEASVYLPLLAAGLALVESIRAPVFRIGSGASGRGDDGAAYLVVFGSAAAALFLKGVVRVSPVHMLLAIVPALVVFAVLTERWWRGANAMRIAAAFVMLLALYPATLAGVREVKKSLYVKDRSVAGWLTSKAGLVKLPVDEKDACETAPASGIAKLTGDYSRVATYLATHTKPNELILAALDRHDKVFANPVGLYFAAGRLPGTHWHQFDPGLVSRADIQTAIIGDLQRHDVRWVVRDASFDKVNEPNGSSQSSGVTILDHYLDANYRPVATSGDVAIWLLNGETPIATGPIERCEAAPAG